MKKKHLLLILISTSLLLTACGGTTTSDIAPENEATYYENASRNMNIGIDALKKIDFAYRLYYDTNTYIVYYWNGASGGQGATMPTAYYSIDGNKCKYNPETGEIYDMVKVETTNE